MQSINKRLLIISLSILFIFSTSFLVVLKTRAAQNIALSVSSSCSECHIAETGDSTVTITTNLDTNTQRVGSVEVNLNYDKDKLKYQSISYNDNFSTSLVENISEDSGTITVIRGQTGGFVGKTELFNVIFKLKAEGNATLSLSPVDAAGESGRLSVTATGTSLNILNGGVNPTPSPTPIITPTPIPTAIITPTPTPTSIPTSTHKPTPKPTPTPMKTVTPTPIITNTVVPTPSPVSTSTTASTQSTRKAANYSNSQVSFDRASAVADGASKICLKITIKNQDIIITTLKPIIKVNGGLNLGEIKLIDKDWQTCFTSNLAGYKKVTVSAGNQIIFDKDFMFDKITVTDSKTENILASVKGPIITPVRKDPSKGQQFTNREILNFSGTAEPNISLAFYVHSSEAIVRKVKTDSTGKWSITLDKPLSIGDHRIDVAYLDQYGNETNTKLLKRFSVAKSFFWQKTILYSIGYILVSILILWLIRRRLSSNQV